MARLDVTTTITDRFAQKLFGIVVDMLKPEIVNILSNPKNISVSLDGMTISTKNLHDVYGEGFFIFTASSVTAAANIQDRPTSSGFVMIRLWTGLNRYTDIYIPQSQPRIFIRNKSASFSKWYSIDLTEEI